MLSFYKKSKVLTPSKNRVFENLIIKNQITHKLLDIKKKRISFGIYVYHYQPFMQKNNNISKNTIQQVSLLT